MDAGRLGRGELIAGISGVVLFIVMFFSWFGYDVAPGFSDLSQQLGGPSVDTSVGFNAWESFDIIDLILLLTVIAAVGLAVAGAAARTVALPVASSAIVTGLGGLSTLLIIYRIIDPPGDASRKIGVFLGLIFAAGITIGGWMAMQEEGATFTPGGGGGYTGGGGAPPPPPPPQPPAGGPPSAPPPAQ
jgi:hypothetical protein